MVYSDKCDKNNQKRHETVFKTHIWNGWTSFFISEIFSGNFLFGNILWLRTFWGLQFVFSCISFATQKFIGNNKKINSNFEWIWRDSIWRNTSYRFKFWWSYKYLFIVQSRSRSCEIDRSSQNVCWLAETNSKSTEKSVNFVQYFIVTSTKQAWPNNGIFTNDCLFFSSYWSVSRWKRLYLPQDAAKQKRWPVFKAHKLHPVASV